MIKTIKIMRIYLKEIVKDSDFISNEINRIGFDILKDIDVFRDENDEPYYDVNFVVNNVTIKEPTILKFLYVDREKLILEQAEVIFKNKLQERFENEISKLEKIKSKIDDFIDEIKDL